MHIEFHSLDELAAFVEWAGFAKRTDALVQIAETINTVAKVAVDVAELAVATPDALPEIESPEGAHNPSEHPVAEAAAAPAEQKRKRRTKAEMEAARAAESGETVAANVAAEQPAGSDTTTAEPVTSQSTADVANPFAQQELPPEQAQPAAKGELAEFLAARLAERPELTNIEHMNLARAFISKHGMPRYSESFALAGLASNVMGYSTADCAKHAAVLDFLASE